MSARITRRNQFENASVRQIAGSRVAEYVDRRAQLPPARSISPGELDGVRRSPPDLVVADIRMPPTNTTERLVAGAPHPG